MTTEDVVADFLNKRNCFMQVLWGEAELFGKKYVLVENYMEYLLEFYVYFTEIFKEALLIYY